MDRAFVETLIRVHRAGEGEPFEGIQPAGTPIDPVVAAADDSLVTGDIGGLRGLITRERLPELERRFQTALARKDFDVNDVQAGPTVRRRVRQLRQVRRGRGARR